MTVNCHRYKVKNVVFQKKKKKKKRLTMVFKIFKMKEKSYFTNSLHIKHTMLTVVCCLFKKVY